MPRTTIPSIVVLHAFDGRTKGDVITDAEAVAAIRRDIPAAFYVAARGPAPVPPTDEKGEAQS